MDHIVEPAVQRGIQKLTINHYSTRWYQLSPSLMRCNSLHQLSLENCIFPQKLPPSIFPNLKELSITSVHLDNDILKTLLSNCTSLETLHLILNLGPPVFSISSLSLRKFGFNWNSAETIELIIRDAPNLESLMFRAAYCNVKFLVLDAPKLKLLVFQCEEFDVLQLGRTFFDRQPAPTFQVKATPCRMMILSSVKTLEIELLPSFSEILPDLLRCFPCLENLYILVTIFIIFHKQFHFSIKFSYLGGVSHLELQNCSIHD
ncbi:hypothetical protein LUZ61_005658 [Rhynchospora tenuis]|uniref:F-box/LRR-repeat protein 15/At3g58940/PEG3-like LRR domain-containing protein n=1 Tax=Rhynchospora tenuis TaxID=198213 RepID=A0AAD6EUV4_9POAL|nr:hypothetical protein LUZ61_005658 [Rhynchospora tenuis]